DSRRFEDRADGANMVVGLVLCLADVEAVLAGPPDREDHDARLDACALGAAPCPDADERLRARPGFEAEDPVPEVEMMFGEWGREQFGEDAMQPGGRVGFEHGEL